MSSVVSGEFSIVALKASPVPPALPSLPALIWTRREQTSIIRSPQELSMKRLNEAIETIPGLNKSYHIGPAYFLKLKHYDGDFEKLWMYHIEGILKEYLRGMPNAEISFKKVEEAYKG